MNFILSDGFCKDLTKNAQGTNNLFELVKVRIIGSLSYNNVLTVSQIINWN